MNQKELDAVFSITILIHENPWFRTKKRRRSREEVQAWVADQLAKAVEVYSIPVGASWGTIVSRERYDEFHNSKKEEDE